MSDEHTDTYTEVTEEPGYFDQAVDALSNAGSAVEHVARAGYDYVSEKYHVHAAVDAESHRDLNAVDEHLDEAGIAHYGQQNELNAAREDLGMEPHDYDAEDE